VRLQGCTTIFARLRWLWQPTTLLVCLAAPLHAADTTIKPLAERTLELIQALDPDALIESPDADRHTLSKARIQIQSCSGYPYQTQEAPSDAARTLVSDLRDGLATGLRCLAGDGPMGRLHPYHEYQAHRLLSLFEARQPKTFQCVADEMFAVAVATGPEGAQTDDPLVRQLVQVDFPGVVIDTYRLGGLLSQRHDDETFRRFFHLNEAQILEHRSGQPLRAANLHRYRNRPGLLFHEVVHWLGHEHSALYPDLTMLYETCCFGGSDYIADPATNRSHQQTACRILKDDEIWSEAYAPRYRQMRLWHYKGYDEFKRQMRADYDS
jgi:hypothetical protein